MENINTKSLNEKRNELLGEMKIITDKVQAEKRNLTQPENEMLSNLDRTQEEVAKQIETLEKVERVNHLTKQEVRTQIISSPYHQGGRPFKVQEEREKAYAGWFYHGTPKAKPEFWRAAEREGIDLNCPQMRFDCEPWESRTNEQVTSSATLGGNVVFNDLQFARNIDVALKHIGNLFQTSTVVDTQTGSALPYPLTDDTGNAAEVTAEAQQIDDQHTTFAQNTLHSYKYDSGFVKVSWELMTDSIIPLADHIARVSGERIGRLVNADILDSGGGTTEIQNIVDGMTVGRSSSSSVSAGPVYADLTAMVESIDYAYQSNPGCGWIFSQAFRALLRNMVDQNQRPLMMSSLEGIALGMPNTLLSYPYYVNAGMRTWGATGSGTAAGRKCAIFGDLKKIIIRRVVGGGEGGYNVLRLNERYAEYGLVAFLTWGRFDAILSDAGTHPVKCLEAPDA